MVFFGGSILKIKTDLKFLYLFNQLPSKINFQVKNFDRLIREIPKYRKNTNLTTLKKIVKKNL